MGRSVLLHNDERLSAAGKNAGWNNDPGCGAVFGNARFGLIFHVDNMDGEKPLFDGILRAESGGGVFLPINTDGCVGLQQVWRPQVVDENAQATWTEAWPNVEPLLEKLGRVGWEIPRGFANVGESGSDAALREAEEETGSVVTDARMLYSGCDNTASSPHMTAVQIGMIDLSRRSSLEGDPNERLVQSLAYFNRLEMARMISSGEIYCNYTLAAIGAWQLQKKD